MRNKTVRKSVPVLPHSPMIVAEVRHCSFTACSCTEIRAASAVNMDMEIMLKDKQRKDKEHLHQHLKGAGVFVGALGNSMPDMETTRSSDEEEESSASDQSSEEEENQEEKITASKQSMRVPTNKENSSSDSDIEILKKTDSVASASSGKLEKTHILQGSSKEEPKLRSSSSAEPYTVRDSRAETQVQ